MTENCRVKMARFFDGRLARLRLLRLGLASALRLGRIDPRHQDLLAPQRRDGRVHGVGDALARDRLARRAFVRDTQMSA